MFIDESFRQCAELFLLAYRDSEAGSAGVLSWRMRGYFVWQKAVGVTGILNP